MATGAWFNFALALKAVRQRFEGLSKICLGGGTVLVSLRFDYNSDADIALDELISQIVVSTSDKAGNEFSRVTIDPNTVPLNPNRAPLYYSATLYHPPRNGRSLYFARIQVFGNYE